MIEISSELSARQTIHMNVVLFSVRIIIIINTSKYCLLQLFVCVLVL